MKSLLLIILISCDIYSATLSKRTIEYGGIKRSFYLYLPTKDVSGFPVVFVLHGGGGSSQKMMALTKDSFNFLSQRYGFIVVYPDGYKNHFNDGRKKPSYDAFRKNIDDVGFLEKIVEYLYELYNVDTGNIFFVGISNGGMMALRMACESVIPKGIAVVAASFPKELYGCPSQSNPSVIIIAGTEDPLVPYNGGEIKGPFGIRWLGEVVKVEDTYAFWSAKNGCEIQETIETITDPFDKKLTATKKIKKCPKAKVALYTINGGGHTWPGGMQYLSVSMVGKTFSGFDAAEEIINFFLK